MNNNEFNAISEQLAMSQVCMLFLLITDGIICLQAVKGTQEDKTKLEALGLIGLSHGRHRLTEKGFLFTYHLLVAFGKYGLKASQKNTRKASHERD